MGRRRKIEEGGSRFHRKENRLKQSLEAILLKEMALVVDQEEVGRYSSGKGYSVMITFKTGDLSIAVLKQSNRLVNCITHNILSSRDQEIVWI